MAIQSGTHLGHYEILAAIGAGGMGEVYRARDLNLGRHVAIKVLPAPFERDTERLGRFQREAKVLASLNHPNIAAIYGLEASGNSHALVMELVEGPTLADRIKQGPIPIDEALKIAKQICDALEYAHERGIVHRDLKPANAKVTADDAVKVLDFGLAKALEGDAASTDISSSPTMSRLATMQGVLLGTAAYMSPEQAKAKPVDRRADVWAFGCVLYEMLTGKRAFDGETVTDTLAAVIRAEPDWSQLPAALSVRVRVLLHRCLQKDPKQRLRDIGDARISLDEVLSGEPDPSLAGAAGISALLWRRTLMLSFAGVLIAAVSGLAVWNLKPAPPEPVTRAVINLPPDRQLAGFGYGPALALSPEGTHLVYVAAQAGIQQIYLRAMDSAEARPIPGTEGGSEPFFSSDSQWLGFFAHGKLKKISVSGGAALDLGDAVVPLGGSWGSQGMIAFTPTLASGLEQLSEEGGIPQPLSRLEKGEVSHRWPEFLPGDKAVLFEIAGSAVGSQIVVQSIGTGERRIVIQAGEQPHYALSGQLVYVQGANLMAVPFDPRRGQVTGAVVPVVEDVLRSALTGAAQYSVSATGSLIYVSGGLQADQRRLVWVNRTGAEQPLPAPAHNYLYPRLSPDGRQVVLTIAEEPGLQLWQYNLSRDTSTRLTFEGTANAIPSWTPDGKRIAFLSDKGGPQNIFWQMADGSGSAERLTTGEYLRAPGSWSPDGQLLAFIEENPATGYDIWVLRTSDRKAQPFLRTPFNESAPEFSPDGRWLAYVSDESGRYEVYVQPYPSPGGKWQISTDGGTEPVWNRNGRELFYRSGEKMMAVDIATQPSFIAGKPRMLFEGKYVPTAGTFPFYDVSPDGERFLMLKPSEQTGAAPTQINVVLNWTEELKRLVPTGK